MPRPIPVISATRSVTTSIVVSLSDILLNLLVAVITGSTVMLSQALQGAADLTTAMLLLIGVKKSKKPADPSHPFGFGREVFFWSLLASIFVLVVSGGFAVMKGVQQVLHPSAIEYPQIALAMLLFGFVTNAYSMRISLRRLGGSLSDVKASSLLERMLHSSLVETKTTILVDLMGTVSAAIGIASISMYAISGEIFFDGAGAVLVGCMTITGAGLLIHNLRDFIVGVSPRQEVINEIISITQSVDHVIEVLDLRALTIGSGKLLVILEVHFEDHLKTDDIELTTDKIKHVLKQKIPTIHRVQVEAETPELQPLRLPISKKN